MITESDLYWITRLDALKCIFGLFTIVFGVVIIKAIFSVYEGKEERMFKGCPLIVSILAVFAMVLSILGLAFVPSTGEMCAIKVIPAVVMGKPTDFLSHNIARRWLESHVDDKADEEIGGFPNEKPNLRPSAFR